MTITKSQKEEIKKAVDEFNLLSKGYIAKKSEHKKILADIKGLESKLKEVEEQEKQEDIFLQKVLSLPGIDDSEVGQLRAQKDRLNQDLNNIANQIGELRTNILKKMVTLPFPIDPNPSQEGPKFLFKMFEDSQLSNTAFKTMCELLDRPMPLLGDQIILSSEKVEVNASSVDEAHKHVINFIQTLRLNVENLSGIYNNIDSLCERVKRSDRYAPILTSLFESKNPLSVSDLSSITKLDESIVYQACYNLIRENWSPSPIKKLPENRYVISAVGRYLMSRYFEKYPPQESEAMNNSLPEELQP